MPNLEHEPHKKSTHQQQFGNPSDQTDAIKYILEATTNLPQLEGGSETERRIFRLTQAR